MRHDTIIHMHTHTYMVAGIGSAYWEGTHLLSTFALIPGGATRICGGEVVVGLHREQLVDRGRAAQPQAMRALRREEGSSSRTSNSHESCD